MDTSRTMLRSTMLIPISGSSTPRRLLMTEFLSTNAYMIRGDFLSARMGRGRYLHSLALERQIHVRIWPTVGPCTRLRFFSLRNLNCQLARLYGSNRALRLLASSAVPLQSLTRRSTRFWEILRGRDGSRQSRVGLASTIPRLPRPL